MSFRFWVPGLALIVLASVCSARSTHDDSTELSLRSAVQVPEAVLQAGKYNFDLEDRLADRAIVKITFPSGEQHFVLSVPAPNLPRTKGLIYFPQGANASDPKVVRGWNCPSCAQSLEFVYPKDEAAKLTGQTGKPIMAFDTSYDKLPDHMSPEDRKVVTLWMLSPKRITAGGEGEGLTAAKYSAPTQQIAANSPEPAKRMPHTASHVYEELFLGLILLLAAGALQLKLPTPAVMNRGDDHVKHSGTVR